MNIIARDSGGQNIVAREQALPRWYPPATAPAAWVDVWKHDPDKPLDSSVYVGRFRPDGDFSMEFNPVTDRNAELILISHSASGTPSVSNLRDGVRVSVLFERDTTSVVAFDLHVPVVTLAPMVAKAGENIDEWMIFTPTPDENSALTSCEIKVEKTDDPSVFEVWPVPIAPHHRIPQKAYPCNISYRYRNQADEDTGGGRGWSVWSPTASAAEAGAELAPVADVLGDFTYDENDTLRWSKRDIIAS